MTDHPESEDWSYMPLDINPLDDEAFASRVVLEVARRNLALRIKNVDRARARMRRAHAEMMQAMQEGRTAIQIVADAAYDVAEAERSAVPVQTRTARQSSLTARFTLPSNMPSRRCDTTTTSFSAMASW